ncbi:MAG: triphosphoribosyl-dephospho-CoA synthase [Planctomycetota bacterium]
MPAFAPTTLTPRAVAAIAALECPAGSRGWSAAVAGMIEATAAKPGNVHPGASFPDLRYDDLLAAAAAIAPACDRAPAAGPGRTILEAVEAARAVVDTNANLGIILLVAPLAAVPDDEPLDAAGVDRVLDRLDATDAALVWRAIARARPGGMGRVDAWDLAAAAPADLRAAMRAAADRDRIARYYADGFAPLFAGPVADLEAALGAGMPLLEAVVDCHLRQLARDPDSLVTRRHGSAAAAAVSTAAAALLRLPAGERPAAIAVFDAGLRAPARLNPGTTADIVAAALYILLRSGRLVPGSDPGSFLPAAS